MLVHWILFDHSSLWYSLGVLWPLPHIKKLILCAHRFIRSSLTNVASRHQRMFYYQKYSQPPTTTVCAIYLLCLLAVLAMATPINNIFYFTRTWCDLSFSVVPFYLILYCCQNICTCVMHTFIVGFVVHIRADFTASLFILCARSLWCDALSFRVFFNCRLSKIAIIRVHFW